MEGVTVYGHHPECRVTFGRGGPHIDDRGPLLQDVLAAGFRLVDTPTYFGMKREAGMKHR